MNATELQSLLDEAAAEGVTIEPAADGLELSGDTEGRWRERLEPHADAMRRFLSGEPLDEAAIPPPSPEQHASEADLTRASERTDVANARRFVDAYHQELLFVPPWGKWLSWDGQRWADDSGTGARQRAKRYADSLWPALLKAAEELDGRELAKVQSFIRATNGRNGIEAFLALAAVDERVVCGVDELNADPLLLNVANGTLDLTTGKLRPHNPADRITQLAPVNYDPAAECPRWTETLRLVFDDDAELIGYAQRLLGYSISGDTGEHVLPICYGSGNNGKSTVWGTVVELLGDYAQLAGEDLLLGERSNHPTDKASLYQLRFVPISEPEKGAALREARCKELTGDRRITARRMREDFWSFDRTHTFWLSTNHLPRVDGTDEGIWRRIKLVPFTVDLRNKVTPIPDFDRWLVANEGPGILAWLVRGFLDYRENGLADPEAVRVATRDYREESDPLGDFIEQFCVLGDQLTAPASDLFAAYADKFRGRWSRTRFGKEMAARFEKARETSGPHRNKWCHRGIALAGEHDDDEFFGNPAKTETYNDLRQAAPGSDVNPMENGKSIGLTSRPGATWRTDPESEPGGESVPPAEPPPTDPPLTRRCRRCGGVMERLPETPVVRGYVNLDCTTPGCDAVTPVRLTEGVKR